MPVSDGSMDGTKAASAAELGTRVVCLDLREDDGYAAGGLDRSI